MLTFDVNLENADREYVRWRPDLIVLPKRYDTESEIFQDIINVISNSECHDLQDTSNVNSKKFMPNYELSLAYLHEYDREVVILGANKNRTRFMYCDFDFTYVFNTHTEVMEIVIDRAHIYELFKLIAAYASANNASKIMIYNLAFIDSDLKFDFNKFIEAINWSNFQDPMNNVRFISESDFYFKDYDYNEILKDYIKKEYKYAITFREFFKVKVPKKLRTKLGKKLDIFAQNDSIYTEAYIISMTEKRVGYQDIISAPNPEEKFKDDFQLVYLDGCTFNYPNRGCLN